VGEIKCRAAVIFIFAVCYLGDLIKNEMGEVCSLDDRRETTTKFYLQNTAESPRGRTRRKCGGSIEIDPK